MRKNKIKFVTIIFSLSVVLGVYKHFVLSAVLGFLFTNHQDKWVSWFRPCWKNSTSILIPMYATLNLHFFLSCGIAFQITHLMKCLCYIDNCLQIQSCMILIRSIPHIHELLPWWVFHAELFFVMCFVEFLTWTNCCWQVARQTTSAEV